MVLLAAKIGPMQVVIILGVIIGIIAIVSKGSSNSSESKSSNYTPPKTSSNPKPYQSKKETVSESIPDLSVLDNLIAQNKTQESVINDMPDEELEYIPKDDKRLAVAEAIKTDSAIEFYYSNYNGEASKRTVSNVDYSDEFGSEYISGYCHLREEDRTFKIQRMSSVKVVS